MNTTVCMGHTNRTYENMARVAARSIVRHSPGLNIKLVRCDDAGHSRNMGTRFEAYIDESADWVLACDADVLCFDDLTPLIERAEAEGLDFVGRISGRYRKVPRAFRMVEYCSLFRRNGLSELALHVPNVFLIRGSLSGQLAEAATRWTEQLYATKTHVLGRPLWSDQVGFTLALAELRLSPERLGFFRNQDVANWVESRRMAQRPRLIHFGARRWQQFWDRGKILGMMQWQNKHKNENKKEGAAESAPDLSETPSLWPRPSSPDGPSPMTASGGESESAPDASTSGSDASGADTVVYTAESAAADSTDGVG